jgi:hypothetical protein
MIAPYTSGVGGREFDMVDADRDKKLDYDEFVVFIKQRERGPHSDFELRARFDALDADKSAHARHVHTHAAARARAHTRCRTRTHTLPHAHSCAAACARHTFPLLLLRTPAAASEDAAGGIACCGG